MALEQYPAIGASCAYLLLDRPPETGDRLLIHGKPYTVILVHHQIPLAQPWVIVESDEYAKRNRRRRLS